MAKNEYTFDIRIEGKELLEEAVAAGVAANRRAEQWRAAALLAFGLLALGLAATLLLGCSSASDDTEPEPQPELCPDVAPAEVPLPAGCVDEPCRDVGDLARCVRTYACESRPGVCVTGWDCACAVELEACLGEGGVPSICEER